MPPSVIAKRRSTPSFSTRTAKVPNRSRPSSTCTKRHEEDGHQLVALVILGPKQEALREKLPKGDRLIVLKKPIKMKQVQEAIHQLLPLS